MSAASLASNVTNIQMLDDIGVQIQWIGSPVGVFAVQVSADYAQDAEGNVTNAGQWTPLVFSYLVSGTPTQANSIPTAAGSPIYLDLTLMSAPWVRTVYTKSSGTGTLTAYITGKMV